MNLATRCRSEFDAITRARGAEYADDGAVQIFLLNRAGLTAEVQGSAREPYDVELDWGDAYDGSLFASCSCPRYADGHLCKHLWAAILAVDAQDKDHLVPGRRSLDVLFADTDDDDATITSTNTMALMTMTRTRTTTMASSRPQRLFGISAIRVPLRCPGRPSHPSRSVGKRPSRRSTTACCRVHPTIRGTISSDGTASPGTCSMLGAACPKVSSSST